MKEPGRSILGGDVKTRNVLFVVLIAAIPMYLGLGDVVGRLATSAEAGVLNVVPPTSNEHIAGVVMLALGLIVLAACAGSVQDEEIRFLSWFSGKPLIQALLLATCAVSALAQSKLEGDVGSVLLFAIIWSGVLAFTSICMADNARRGARLVFIGFYFLAAILMPLLLRQINTMVDIDRSSLLTQGLYLACAAAEILILMVPFFSLSGRAVGIGKRILHSLRPFAPAIWLLAYGPSASILLWASLSEAPDPRLSIARSLSWVVLLVGGFLVIAPAIEPKNPANRETSTARMSSWPNSAVLASVIVGYLIVAVTLAQRWLPFVGPDGLSYLDIARAWGEGNFIVRAYWSPLISWLAAIPISLGAAPLVGLRAVNVLGGLIWIFASYLIGVRLKLSRLALAFLVIATGLMAARYAVEPTTPDALATGIVLLGVALTFGLFGEFRPLRFAVGLGLVAILSGYAKYYNLAFMTAWLALIIVIFPDLSLRTRLVVLVVSVATMAVLMVPWLIGVYHRYGRPVWTTSSSIAHALAAPGSNVHHRCWQAGLCPEPGDVLFPQEDPAAVYYPNYGWSVFGSAANLKHEVALFESNARIWVRLTTSGVGSLLPVATVLTFALAMYHWDDIRLRTRGLLLSGGTILYASGYMLTLGDTARYYFPTYSLMLASAYFTIDVVLRTLRGRETFASAFGPIFAVCVLTLPILSMGKISGIQSQLAASGVDCLSNSGQIDASLLEAPMAGTDYSINFLAYETRVRTFGVLEQTSSASEVLDQVRSSGVKSLVLPDRSPVVLELVSKNSYEDMGRISVCGRTYAVLNPR